MNENEKKVLLGETTYLSIGLTALLIGATYSISQIKSELQANAAQIDELQQKQMYIMEKQIQQSENISKELKELNLRLGRIEGKLNRRQ